MILSVLNTIARKSTTLSVRGTGVFSFLTLLQLKGDPFQRLDSPKSTAMSPKHTLSALMIEADIMRLAVFRDWITAVLKDNKTVTCLWLSGVCYVDTYWVPHAINSLPMLTELRIYGSNVLPEEILNAIAQFPLLTHLLLDGCNWKDNQSMKLGVVMGTNPHMPLLRALIAPVEYVAFFLERADALPCLENLTVSIKPSSGPLFVEDTLRSLRYLADRIDRLHRSRSNFPSLSFLARLPMHLGYMTSVGWEVIPQLTTELIFKVMANFNSFDTSAAEYLRRWLPTWVGLQRLRFEFEGDEAQLLESVLADLQFAELCPTLRQVVLSGPNGRTHNLGSSPMGVKD
ncbi:hypothetical protein FPV67DRAFT_1468194 [Lyophyllum atratum]|nr:hypothetical protein FPV67DRAFT_1468194 [Lyophyllum atratum]